MLTPQRDTKRTIGIAIFIASIFVIPLICIYAGYLASVKP